MATTAVSVERKNYLNAEHGIRSWLFTTDHKRIAMLYLLSITAMFFVGGFFALMIRLELLTPAGDLLLAYTYNKMFSMHGQGMVFFFLVPPIRAGLGNFLVPSRVGAKDLAFPRINLLSWYLYIAGAGLYLWCIINGGVDTGWTFYTPYSSLFSNTHVVEAGLAIFIAGFSSILTGLNFVVTVHRMRAPGMTWSRLPLFVWSHYAVSIVMLLGTPVIAITLVLLILERALNLGIFDPSRGGDPVLFQHLFWFYSHPAVYIMILPAMGVVSEVIPTYAHKNLLSYSAIVYSTLGIAFVGFLTWGHHMFVAGISVFDAAAFGVLSMLVAIFSAIKVFTWVLTMRGGSVVVTTPLLYFFAFLFLFVFGGMTGVAVATQSLDVHWHDTYFVVAHFHFIMVGSTLTAWLAALHYWFPKITGRMYPERMGYVGATLVFSGFFMTFFPQFLLGNAGMPRRYYDYDPQFQPLHVVSTVGAWILGAAMIWTLTYLLVALFRGERAPANPWDSRSYEWLTPSPPPKHNFFREPVFA